MAPGQVKSTIRTVLHIFRYWLPFKASPL